MPLEALTAVSSIDGRYRGASEALALYFSEYALMHKRLVVECEYLIALSKTPKTGVRRFSDNEIRLLRKLLNISLEDARAIKAIEKETNHDVKAIEYFIKQKLEKTSLADVAEWAHFALTSEDVNSVAHGFALRSAIEGVILPALQDVERALMAEVKAHAKTPMLARTHGQSASPTTFGKEMRVFLERLRRQVDTLATGSILVKWGGATGNYNAHVAASPEVDWLRFAKRFIDGLNTGTSGKKYLIKIVLNKVTTQVEPHDTYAELFDNMRRINTILLDFSQDIFENAEGNLGVANALFEHFSRKLPVSRLQRDLSDSTVKRTFGSAFAHSVIAYKSLVRGMGKVSVNKRAMLDALRAHPEVLAEAIQTALRREGVPVPYEKLKELTRGREVSLGDFAKFINGLDISDKTKKRLKALRPETYIGLADKIARSL